MTNSHVEEMVQESTQSEGVDASVVEATTEVGEISILPAEEAIPEAGEILVLQDEEATTEVGKTPTPQDSPKGSTSLDLQPGKGALMPQLFFF